MKRTSIIPGVIISFLVLSGFAQMPKQNDRQEEELKGNVKSLHETFYKAEHKSGEIIKGKKICNEGGYESKISFNDKGYKTEDTRFKVDGSPSAKLVYAYNDKSDRIEEDKYNTDGSVAHKSKFDYKYDDTGKMIEKDWFKEDGSSDGKEVYKYDEKGNIIEKNVFRADGTLDWRTADKYNDKGNVIETIEYKSSGEIILRFVFKYNDYGKVVEETWFTKGTKFLVTYLQTYDSKGNRVKTDWVDAKGKAYAMLTYKIEYDKNDNWIRVTELNPDKVSFFGGRDECVVEREIEYF